MSATTATTTPTRLCGPRLMARLHQLVGDDVEIVTLRMRYRGRLLAVHPKAVWLELHHDCRVALSEPLVSVAVCPNAEPGAEKLQHPAMSVS